MEGPAAIVDIRTDIGLQEVVGEHGKHRFSHVHLFLDTLYGLDTCTTNI
jgi:hypothetical protein